MTLGDLFAIHFNKSEADGITEIGFRFLGLDFIMGIMHRLEDWLFPFSFLPSKRGFYIQSCFLGGFIGRKPE